MKGKIFAESSNIYQDQAKVLFDYYRQAAEKIVAEEERLEKEIAILEEEKAVRSKESILWMQILGIVLLIAAVVFIGLYVYSSMSGTYSSIVSLVFGVPLFIGGLVLTIMHAIKNKKKKAAIADLTVRINEFQQQHKDIFRDYKVTKLGVAYVPIADQIKYDDKSFIVDYTGAVPESEVTLQLSRQNDLMIETIEKLEHLTKETPFVETAEEPETIPTDMYSTSIQEINQNDYLGGLERAMRTISYCMSDLDTTSVSLPLVADKSQYLQFINEFTTDELPENATVIPVFSQEQYKDSVTKFQELNKLKDSLSTKTQQFEDVLKSLMLTISNSVQAISQLKIASVDKVVFESNKLLFQILKAPYNQYSPMLEFEEIERIRNERFDYSDGLENSKPFNLRQSSRLRFNLTSGLWTAEDGNTTNLPFGVHQLYEEIVAPVVNNLMEENRIERLKIYNHIKDQKIHYLNEWHRDTDAFYRDNRAQSSDIINLMQDSLREYVAAYNTLISLKRTEDNMKQSQGNLHATVTTIVNNTDETLAAFELQSKEFQKAKTDFEDYMERLKEDIDLKAEKFGHVEYYDARLRDGYSHEVAVANSEIHELDDRRKTLASVNPLFAKTSELPPQPQVEDITFEHISLNLPVITTNALEELEKAVFEQSSEEEDEWLEDAPIQDDELLEEEIIEEDDEEEELDDEEYDEDDEEYDDEEGDDEDDEEFENLSAEDLAELDDAELQEMLDYLEIPYDAEAFDREEAIASILESQEEEEDINE